MVVAAGLVRAEADWADGTAAACWAAVSGAAGVVRRVEARAPVVARATGGLGVGGWAGRQSGHLVGEMERLEM